MIDPLRPLASWFLLSVSVFFVALYAIPLLWSPFMWARWFQWRVPEGRSDVTVYFGRCVGGLALAILAMVVQAIPDPLGHRFVFELIGWVGGAMVYVHVLGAIQRIQPWTENVEIFLFGAVAAVSLWIRSTLI